MFALGPVLGLDCAGSGHWTVVRRALFLAVLAVLAAPGPAGAAVCKVPGPEARVERDVREQIRVRGNYGFRSDRAYVQALIARHAWLRQWGIYGTGAEARYLRRRDTLRLGAKATAYLRKRPAIADWWDVRDDWPRGAYVAVFVAADPARYRGAIRRLAAFPRATRVVRVRSSERARDRVVNRIERDEKALHRMGFTLIDAERGAPGTDRVDVNVVTRRHDAARVFARRYGTLVHAHSLGPTTQPLACTRAASYEIAPDGMSVTVHWSDAPRRPAAVELIERGDRVVIGVVVRSSVYPGFGDSGGSAVVALHAPLGARAVYDADDGERLLQTGPAPGDPACPAPPAPSPLDDAIRERARYGMNTDPAYVQSLLAQGRTFTDDEQRWLDGDRALEDQGKLSDYLFHWARDWGGNTIVGSYPDKPYLLVRFLRRRAFHERRIKRLAKYPDQLRTIRSTVQRDWFYTLPQYIGDDALMTDDFLDGYGRAGFYVVLAEGHEETQSVDVTVITPRADAAAYFAARYGPLVRVHVIGDRFECRGSYER
jgi:hypothetical protein